MIVAAGAIGRVSEDERDAGASRGTEDQDMNSLNRVLIKMTGPGVLHRLGGRYDSLRARTITNAETPRQS